MSIPQIDAACLFNPGHAGYQAALEEVRVAAEDIGFMTINNTSIDRIEVERVMSVYRQFFLLPEQQKAAYSMASTGSNRGWGEPAAEQVDPAANPDYKEVFDCGLELESGDPLATQTYYAPNRWPRHPREFRSTVQGYYVKATVISRALLSAVAQAIGQPSEYFADKFDKPMALLRGNYYPARPSTAGSKDFGIAPHTDYGCLTLLATDGSPGLEIQGKDGDWIAVTASPGTFVINFGEMLQMWSAGRVVATPHRVIGGSHERISIPFFFNPRFDANVAPWGSGEVALAGDHLSKRYDETYIHRQKAGKT
ncbi:MAG: isopenicillin N synthase family dioxygenase [Granulosicoccus sp.]